MVQWVQMCERCKGAEGSCKGVKGVNDGVKVGGKGVSVHGKVVLFTGGGDTSTLQIV